MALQVAKVATYWEPKVSTSLFADGEFYPPTHMVVVVEDDNYLVPWLVERGGYLLVGKVSIETNPRGVKGAREIWDVSHVPNLRTLSKQHIAVLGAAA